MVAKELPIAMWLLRCLEWFILLCYAVVVDGWLGIAMRFLMQYGWLILCGYLLPNL